VLDASKSVVVVGTLLSEDKKEECVEDLLEEYEELREDWLVGRGHRRFRSSVNPIHRRKRL
jgi:5-methyltetrahydrofolate--homocysteine methyltransferase